MRNEISKIIPLVPPLLLRDFYSVSEIDEIQYMDSKIY